MGGGVSPGMSSLDLLGGTWPRMSSLTHPPPHHICHQRLTPLTALGASWTSGLARLAAARRFKALISLWKLQFEDLQNQFSGRYAAISKEGGVEFWETLMADLVGRGVSPRVSSLDLLAPPRPAESEFPP